MSPSLSIFGGQAPAERENPHEDRKLEDQFPVQMAVCKADKKCTTERLSCLIRNRVEIATSPKGTAPCGSNIKKTAYA